MSKQSAPQEAKIFKFKFTLPMILVAIAALALCAVGIGLSIWRIVKDGIHDFGDVLKSPFLIAISVFAIVVIVALLVHSRYVVTKQSFTIQFGFIKNTYDLSKVTSLLLDTDSHKLTVYMGEEFFVVTTNPEWNNDLVQAVREGNPDVEFNFTLAEPKNPDKK